MIRQRSKKAFLLLLFAGLVEDVSEVASAAILAIEMSRHKDAGAAILVRALTTETSDFTILVNLEERKM